MTEERYIKYKTFPIDAKFSNINLDKLLYEGEELYINLHIFLNDGKEKILQIYFEYVLVFRNTDESYLLKTIEEQSEQINFKWGKIFYKVENSQFVNWFNDQSCNIPKKTGVCIEHYAIYSGTDCIDVISSSEPEIKWLD